MNFDAFHAAVDLLFWDKRSTFRVLPAREAARLITTFRAPNASPVSPAVLSPWCLIEIYQEIPIEFAQPYRGHTLISLIPKTNKSMADLEFLLEPPFPPSLTGQLVSADLILISRDTRIDTITGVAGFPYTINPIFKEDTY